MSLTKLAWLGSRLLGFGRVRPGTRPEPDGTVLSRGPGPAVPGHPGVRVEGFRYASDGYAVAGVAVRPREFEGRLPLLLYSRGGLGPHGVVEAEDLDFLADLAARGPYQVLATQYRGNGGGEGEDRAGPADSRDLVNLIPVVADDPDVDHGRVYVVGFSRGGTMAMMANRRGFRPAAIAVIGCVADLARAFHEGSRLLRGAIRVSTGGRPEARPLEYLARSPLFWADELDVPILLLHGTADETISVGQSRRFAAALAAAGRPHELTLVPGGNHKLLTHPDRRREEVLRFFRARSAAG